MSNFTASVAHTVEFEGDTITMSLYRLKRKDMQKLLPFIELDDEGRPLKMSFKSQAEFSEAAIGFLPSSVSNFKGLKDAEGTEVSFETVVEEIYFQDIVTDIVGKLFKISRLDEDDVKNSDAPSAIATRA